MLLSDSVRALEGEGMNDYKHHNLRGNIYFVFDVKFPENGFLDEAKLQVSMKCFSSRFCLFVCFCCQFGRVVRSWTQSSGRRRAK